MEDSDKSIQRAISELMLHVARPLIWRDVTQKWPKTLSGATCFFLRFPSRVIGVTADHVVQAYEEQRKNNPNIVCQLRNSDAFDLIAAIIDRCSERDIATFLVDDRILEMIDAIAIDCCIDWPPPKPQQFCQISACGFPESERKTDFDRSAEFGAWGAFAALEDVTETEIIISFDPKIAVQVPWAPQMPPIGMNLSGCSGGPVLMHWNNKKIHRFLPIALISQGPRALQKEGEAAEFDLIRFKRINIIRSDGTLEKKTENLGWLPS